MRKYKKRGMHIIGDLFNCDFNSLTKDQTELKKTISSCILKNGLKELGSFYHFFDSNVSFTAVISLAESHISVHTWPEDEYVSLDVYVCNHTIDNSQNAEQLFTDLVKLFCPLNVRIKNIKR
jgi:S-adenosylmethionine decarboxylase proenzyme